MHVYNPKRKVPTPDRSASARRGAPAARGPVLTTLISALRRRRTSSCAARYAYFYAPRDSSLLSRRLRRTSRSEICNEYRDYRQRGIISRWKQRAPGFLQRFSTTSFIFSRMRINVDEHIFHCARSFAKSMAKTRRHRLFNLLIKIRGSFRHV